MPYTVEQGDIIWISLDPQAEHEQKGRRPALVISNNTFNSFTRTAAILCPITNSNRNNPLQVRLDGRTATGGVIMCDQAKILDVGQRNAAFIEKAPAEIIDEVVDIIAGFITVGA
ncbi:MAG: type II toxin-antitoxin system PemK/MazF family toxin [Oscillospiraceae bacterium]|jgi:mRNA interferase MazF|nr:type II toxin-antitoxin system PemK/MazF family toxin [Oscillospiraceae bacterium]